MKRLLRKIKRSLRVLQGGDVFLKPTLCLRSELHGTDYGGWVVLADSLTANSVVLSAGLGHDISFDVSIIEKYGCNVIGYDPDPKACAFHKTGLPSRLDWRRIGLSNQSREMKLYRPHREDWVSGTLIPGAINHSQDYDLVQISDIAEVLREFSGEIDVLKMDIEGAEYAVIDRMVETGDIRRIRQLLIEFHHGNKFRGIDTKRSVQIILSAGFELFFVSDIGHEFSFCRKDIVR